MLSSDCVYLAQIPAVEFPALSVTALALLRRLVEYRSIDGTYFALIVAINPRYDFTRLYIVDVIEVFNSGMHVDCRLIASTDLHDFRFFFEILQIGRASCRERV